MKIYTNIKGFFSSKGPADIEKFVVKNLDISNQIYHYLKEKVWTQKELAKEPGKSEAEV